MSTPLAWYAILEGVDGARSGLIKVEPGPVRAYEIEEVFSAMFGAGSPLGPSTDEPAHSELTCTEEAAKYKSLTLLGVEDIRQWDLVELRQKVARQADDAEKEKEEAERAEYERLKAKFDD